MSLNVEPGAVGDEAGDLRAMAAMALRIQILEDALGTMDRQLDAANTRVAELEDALAQVEPQRFPSDRVDAAPDPKAAGVVLTLMLEGVPVLNHRGE
ncbi:hypothetical protein T484DRAFT_1950206 [Baffinella frigidus]|nr:hypothetical protein T484DRAFT_1950206 [Cryptophyta sp. CCMP2293]